MAAAAVATLAFLMAVLVVTSASPSDADVGDVVTIEAEDFTAGAYNDTEPGNQGNSSYRAGQDADVYLAYNDAGNHVIGRTRAGEWTEYAVDVAENGGYRVNLRIASGLADPGDISVTIDGTEVGSLDVANSGSWWTWVTPDLGTADLTAGAHTVRVTWGGAANINFDRFTLTQVSVNVDDGCPTLTVQAEDATITGDMAVGSDAGATGGAYLTTAIGGSQSAPNISYAELCVTVPTAGRYRLDGRVQNPNNRDDSFWVSIDGGGDALWDTTISNGWTTDAVSARLVSDPAVWQLASGQHTIRVSAREDGSKVDQLTLTPTNLPASDLAPPPDNEPRTPAGPNVVPGRLQAELFDYGTAADPAYSDTEATNVGGAFRPSEGVDIWNTFGGDGFVVGRTRGGEFVEFTVFPEQAGTYNVTARVASGFSQPGSISVTSGNETAGPVAVAADGWWNFQEVELGTIDLDAAAEQVIRLNWFGNGQINTDWIELTPGLNEPDPDPDPDPEAGVIAGPYVDDPRQTPFGNAPIRIPGTIQVENYDRGGQGVAWNDTPVFSGNSDYRRDGGVDIGKAIDPFGRFVGWIDDGDWMEYSLVVEEEDDWGTFALFSRVASAVDEPGSMLVSLNGTPMAKIDIPATGGWQSWQTIGTGGFQIPAGNYTLRLTALGSSFNVNWVRFTKSSGDGPYRRHEAPGLIQLEDYDFGNNRIGYKDNDAENRGGEYRLDPVDKYVGDDVDTSYYVGNTGDGEWLQYSFTADQTGAYDLHVRAESADGSNQPVELLIDGEQVSTLNFTSASWATKKATGIPIAAGEHELRVRTPDGSVNLNWLQITNTGASFTPPTALSGTVQVAPDQDLGMLALRAAPGTTFEILPGTHRFAHVSPKDNQKFIGVGALGDAKLDGERVRTSAFRGNGNNVEIRNLEMFNYGQGLFIGVVSARDNFDFSDSGSNWIVEGNYIHDNTAAGINLGPGMQVLNNEIAENEQIGISGVGRDITRLPDVLIEGNKVHHNGPEEADMLPFFYHEGGMKTTFSDRLIVRDNDFYENYGVGIYCDLYCDDILYEKNRIIDNIGPNHGGGIFYEWSTNGTIFDNTISNGNADPARAKMYGILVGESQDVAVIENDVTAGSHPALDLRACCAVNDDPTTEREPNARVTFERNTVVSTSDGTIIRWLPGQATFVENNYQDGTGKVQFIRGTTSNPATLNWSEWRAAGQDINGTLNG